MNLRRDSLETEGARAGVKGLRAGPAAAGVAGQTLVHTEPYKALPGLRASSQNSPWAWPWGQHWAALPEMVRSTLSQASILLAGPWWLQEAGGAGQPQGHTRLSPGPTQAGTAPGPHRDFPAFLALGASGGW